MMQEIKIFLFYSGSGNNKRLVKLIEKESIDSWIFLGNNALKRFEIEKKVLLDIKRINISKYLSQSQYDNFNTYLDFVDNLEKNTGNKLWWSSRLCGKNPWISKFYLRITQLDVFNQVICKQKNQKKKILIIVDDYALHKTLSVFCKSKNFAATYVNDSHAILLKLKYYLKGYRNRFLYILKYLLDNVKYKRIFKTTSFNIIKSKEKKLIIVPTFIDSRSFRTGEYKDPFLGEIIEKNIWKDRNVVIVPIVISATKMQLQLFNSWLRKKGFSVLFLTQTVSIIGHCREIIINMFQFPQNARNIKYMEYNIDDLIIWERVEEWSSYNLKHYLMKNLAEKMTINSYEKIIVYPFENQVWERLLLFEMKRRNNIYSIGIQNAPCPKLSTRYFFSMKLIEYLPLPDIIITNGEISYNNLKKYYNNYVKLVLSSSVRPIVKIDSIINRDKNDGINVMIGCSTGKEESIELIIFIIESLRFQKHLNISIVPHPLVKYDYASLLKSLDCPDHIKLSKLGFVKELSICDSIIFDSSTVGLEALSNGIQPIFIGHECSIHVNPNEFDTVITKYVYNKDELIKTFDSIEDLDVNVAKSISDKYFGNKNSLPIKEILSKNTLY